MGFDPDAYTAGFNPEDYAPPPLARGRLPAAMEADITVAPVRNRRTGEITGPGGSGPDVSAMRNLQADLAAGAEDRKFHLGRSILHAASQQAGDVWEGVKAMPGQAVDAASTPLELVSHPLDTVQQFSRGFTGGMTDIPASAIPGAREGVRENIDEGQRNAPGARSLGAFLSPVNKLGLAAAPAASALQGGSEAAIAANLGEEGPSLEDVARNVSAAGTAGLALAPIQAGAARARGYIRSPGGHTSRDINLVEKYGGRASPTGIHGGAFDRDPALIGKAGGNEEIAQAGRASGDEILKAESARYRALGDKYAADRSAWDRGPEAAKLIDATPIVNSIDKLLLSEKTTDTARAALRGIYNRFTRYQNRNGTFEMPAGTLNDLRSVIDDAAHIGEGRDMRQDAQIASIYKESGDLLYANAPELQAINKAYADGKADIRSVQGNLGIKHRGVAAQNVRTERLAAAALRRQGDESYAAGGQSKEMEAIRAARPEYEYALDRPTLLRARQRLSFGFPSLQGSLRGAASGFVGRNFEPLVGRVIDPALAQAEGGLGGMLAEAIRRANGVRR